MNHLIDTLPVAVLGAGPVGMAAAAHLVQQGFTPLVLEAGPALASNLERYRHVRMFSPWRYNIDRAAGALLAREGWTAPDLEALPTAGEIIDQYLVPLAALPALKAHINFGHGVRMVAREGYDRWRFLIASATACRASSAVKRRVMRANASLSSARDTRLQAI